MIINAPLLIYSLGLLISLYCFENELQLSYTLWYLSLLSSILKVLCWIPIAATLVIAFWDGLCHRNNSTSHLYDSDGNKVESNSNININSNSYSNSNINSINHLPFLPDKDYCTKEEYNLIQNEIKIKNEIKIETKRPSKTQQGPDTITLPSSRASWALVTGASQGIGRSICISLARRNIPLIMVARNGTKLNALAKEIRDNYGVTAIPIQCDLSNLKSIDALLETLEASTPNQTRLMDGIDILINNAGLGHSSLFFQNDNNNNNDNNNMDSIETMVQLNILGTTKLTQAIGQSMKNNSHRKKQGGRIVFVSSIMGAFPGVPGSAVYAATKAYQRSLCASLGRELELELKLKLKSNSSEQELSRHISVTCVLPGGVSNTGFASASQMTESAIFHLLPGWGLALKPEPVAEAIVRAAISGTQREVTIGWIYNLYAILLVHVIPKRLQVILAGIFCGDKRYFEFQFIGGRILSKILINSNATSDNEHDRQKND